MRKISGHSAGVSLIIKRALEGRMSPLNFLLVLGFFCSLVLLYISLHVYFFSMSQDISERRDKLELLMDNNVRLTAEYNDLVSPDRIIPIVRKLGMRVGSPAEIKRLALYESKERRSSESIAWARGGTEINGDDGTKGEPEGR
jgi:hypothetical protein